MKTKLKFSISDNTGSVSSSDDAVSELDEEKLVIAPVSGGPINISLRDVSSVQEGDYQVHIGLRSGESMTLSNVGFQYEDLVRSLFRAVNELEMKDLLFGERLIKQDVQAEVAALNSSGDVQMGKCEVRLYETALLIMPERLGLVRLRYRDVLNVETIDHRMLVAMESGDRFQFGKLGRELDPLHNGLMAAVSDISSAAQTMVKEAYPEASLTGVQRAAQLLKDGRTARREELEQACPGLWDALERRLSGYGMGEEFAFLSSLSGRDQIGIGMKRPLHAKEKQDYVFFLAPIFSSDRRKGGNAIAFEASSEEGEGRATYLFRIWGRKEYQKVMEEGMSEAANEACKSTIHGLEAVNFRREPIYLADEDLNTPERSEYRYAIMRIPELRRLRETFIGRVVHSSPDQWKQDIVNLLKFNVEQQDDSAAWKKGEGAQ